MAGQMEIRRGQPHNQPPSPPPPRGASWEGDVLVPAGQAALVGLAAGLGATVVAAGVGYLAGNLSGLRLVGLSLGAGVVVGAVSFSLAAVSFVRQHRALAMLPVEAVRWRMALAEETTMPEEPPVIPSEPLVIYGQRPRLTGGTVQVNYEAPPPVDRETRLVYEFLLAAYEFGQVSRSKAMKYYLPSSGRVSRTQWERLVGGYTDKLGRKKRGILDIAGIVEQTGNGWQLADIDLEEAMSRLPAVYRLWEREGKPDPREREIRGPLPH